jgi:catechol 2,3-dioxygenase-like lactoylglutathione lyase family enzyme
MGRQLQVAIDCADPDRLAAFWTEVLDYRVADPPPGYPSWPEFSNAAAAEHGERWCRIVDPDGVGASLLFHRVPEGKVGKNRVHIDIRVRPPGSSDEDARPYVDAEARRLVDLGGTHLRTDADEEDYYAVMQDPEGNEFCVG